MSEYSDLDRQIEQLKRCEIIKENEVKALCAKAREILVEEGNVQRVDSPVTVSFLFIIFNAHHFLSYLLMMIHIIMFLTRNRYAVIFMDNFTISKSYSKLVEMFLKRITYSWETLSIEDIIQLKHFCSYWHLR